MSRYIATRAIRGANAIVAEAEAQVVHAAIAELGPETPVAFTNTAYYLPVIYAFTGSKVEKLGDLAAVLERARKALLHPVPAEQDVAAVPGRDARLGRRHAVRRRGHRGRALRAPAEPQVIKLGRRAPTASASPAATCSCTATR